MLALNKSPVYASLEWLKAMNAIVKADVECFNRVKACRNTLARDLLSTLGSHGLPDDFEELFSEMVALIHKMEVWRVMNVDIPTNPNTDGSRVDEEGKVPGPIMAIQLLYDIALRDEERS
ncbi:MAG: hypothetical protein ACKO22_13585 [Cyanobium sp.]